MTDKPQTIFRIKKNKDNPYYMMDKRPIYNPALSWKAKGILAYLISRPDDWTLNVRDLINRSTDKDASVRAGIKELICAGHIVYHGRERIGGQVGRAIWEVHEMPIEPDSENQHQAPDSDFPNQEKPNQENHPLTNIESTKNENTNISASGEKKKNELPGIEPAIFSGREVTQEDIEHDRSDVTKMKNIAELVEMQCPGAGDLVLAFQITRGIVFLEKDVKGQRSCANDLLQQNVKPEHVVLATKQLMSARDKKGHPFTVTKLQHIETVAVNIANGPIGQAIEFMNKPSPEEMSALRALAAEQLVG